MVKQSVSQSQSQSQSQQHNGNGTVQENIISESQRSRIFEGNIVPNEVRNEHHILEDLPIHPDITQPPRECLLVLLSEQI